MQQYSSELQQKLVAKLLQPNGPSVIELSESSGVSRSALYKWLNKFKHNRPDIMQKSNNGKKITDWTAEEKLSVVIATANMDAEQLGKYCRENGLYVGKLQEWRNEMLSGLQHSSSKAQKIAEQKLTVEIKKLQRELTRKDRALSETAALLVLKKKADLIWGGNEEDT